MKTDLTKKIISFIALCLMLCMVITGCADQTPQSGDPTEAGSSATGEGTNPTEDATADQSTTAPSTSAGTATKTPGTTTSTATNAPAKVNIDLRFSSTGKFKVVILSDLRLSKSVSSTVIKNIEKVLDQEKPDLVLLGGDIHDGTIANEKDLRTILDAVNAPLEARKIPWCHTFGVDAAGTATKKTGYSKVDQMKVYQSYPYCVSKTDFVEGNSVSNYVLPIKKSTGNKVGFNVWCLDANGYLNDYQAGLEDKVLLKGTLSGKTNLDCIHFTQRLWYYNTSVQMQKDNGGTLVPGMMYFQVAPQQFRIIYKNKDRTNMVGTSAEKQSSPERESGIVWTLYERGDVKGLFCGYEEQNDYQGTYVNMVLAHCSTVGKTTNTATAGARVVNISNNGSKMETSMVYVSSLK